MHERPHQRNQTAGRVLAGAGGSLTKAGAGLLTLAGQSTYAGATVVTAGTAITCPASGGMAYKLQAVIFGAEVATTQTVALVHSNGQTNQIATHVVSATGRMLTVTNCPWMFSGEKVWIGPSSGGTNGVVLVGETSH